jgi:hypothetical protein
MLGITRVRIAPNLPLIGKDLDAGATFNADVVANILDLEAGTIMVIPTPGAPMVPAAVADIGNTAVVIGILAADSYQAFDSTGGIILRPAMIYRRGVFIRSTINDINGRRPAPELAPINPGDANDVALNVRGIHLEESWDANELDVPPFP